MWISSPARSRTYRSAGSSPKRPSLPIPTRVRIPDTADGAIPSVSAISGPVNRNRLRAAIASTRRSQVRFATNLGAEGRSTRPPSPSTRNRPTHLRAHRTLTSAAAAASVTVRPSTTTRRQSSRLLFRLRAALACNFIRCPPWDWWRQTPPASKGARMNQPPQELHLAHRRAAEAPHRQGREQPREQDRDAEARRGHGVARSARSPYLVQATRVAEQPVADQSEHVCERDELRDPGHPDRQRRDRKERT